MDYSCPCLLHFCSLPTFYKTIFFLRFLSHKNAATSVTSVASLNSVTSFSRRFLGIARQKFQLILLLATQYASIDMAANVTGTHNSGVLMELRDPFLRIQWEGGWVGSCPCEVAGLAVVWIPRKKYV